VALLTFLKLCATAELAFPIALQLMYHRAQFMLIIVMMCR